MEKQKFCVWIKLEDGHQCTQCGKIKPRQTLRECGKVPTAIPILPQAAPPQTMAADLLGDRIEKLLSKLGITQEHYMDVKKKLGMKELCKCGYRKNLLNLVSKYARQHGWIKTFKNLREIKRYLDEPR